MKKMLVSALLLIVASTFVWAQDYDVRKIRWGMSRAQVIAAEGQDPYHTDDETNMIVYKTKMGTMDALVGYRFVDDKVWFCKVIFLEKHTNKNDYITDYSNVKDIMKNKYGNPDDDEVYWKNRLYSDERDQYGFAVSLGHLIFSSTWEKPETHIFLVLMGENYDITHAIEYSSVALKAEAKRREEKKATEDFE